MAWSVFNCICCKSSSISNLFNALVDWYTLAWFNDSHSLAGSKGDKKAVIDFRGNILVGDLDSRTALKLVREWIDLHQAELAEDWEIARAGRQIKKIAPLE